jgi:hypothetical protein
MVTKTVCAHLLAFITSVSAFTVLAEVPTQRIASSLKPSLGSFQHKQAFLASATETSGSSSSEHLEKVMLSQGGGQYKSKGRAFMQSLIVPGWGQHYAQSKTMTKVFVASEALLWAGFAGFTLRSNWLEEDYRTFAVTHAGVELSGKPAGYFVDIGSFDDIADYNQAQLRDHDVEALYPETDEFFWRWDSEENRRRFDSLRIRSDRAANRADLTLAMIFVNHLVSALQATLAVHKYNKRFTEEDMGMNIDLHATPEDRRINFTLFKRF